jgi:two-component sensor histidine kinase
MTGLNSEPARISEERFLLEELSHRINNELASKVAKIRAGRRPGKRTECNLIAQV